MTKLSLHEKVVTKLFNTNEKLTFFDIGACEGLSSVRYLSIFSNAEIFTFEPVPKNFEKVLKNKEKHNLKTLYPFQLGLSFEIGEATFYLSSGHPPNKEKPDDNSSDFGNKSSSLYKPDKTKEIHPWLKFKETITIKTTTLDNFCETKKVTSIDFIHMDVQGAELMVLQGGKNMLKNIKSIWLEVEKISLYKDQALKKDIENFLSNRGFVCQLNKVNHIAGDQLWVRKSYLRKMDSKTKLYLSRIKMKTQIKSNLSTFYGGLLYKIKNLSK
ncbi:FkbM family methyltransferase [Polaribacter sp.]|uniref:FkbM family methyltransferase n=1 Tax=Polaribacter sp. TaxID=1920175 RepID=UPI003EF2A37D